MEVSPYGVQTVSDASVAAADAHEALFILSISESNHHFTGPVGNAANPNRVARAHSVAATKTNAVIH